MLVATSLFLLGSLGFGAEAVPKVAPGVTTSAAVVTNVVPATNALAPRQTDVLIGTNGERFTGTLVEETAELVVFQSELGGRITVPRARVLEIQRAPPSTIDHRPMINNSPSAPSPITAPAGAPVPRL